MYMSSGSALRLGLLLRFVELGQGRAVGEGRLEALLDGAARVQLARGSVVERDRDAERGHGLPTNERVVGATVLALDGVTPNSEGV